jgi:pyruvate/2-oxoglutarate dehydrogenase complex dihydrolipoamide acyltransferase (E2) component
MISVFRTPLIDPEISQYRVLMWHSWPAAPIVRGDVLVELETMKSVIEIRALQSGYLIKQLVAEGTWVQPKEAIAYMGDTSDVIQESMDVTPLSEFMTDFTVC